MSDAIYFFEDCGARSVVLCAGLLPVWSIRLGSCGAVGAVGDVCEYISTGKTRNAAKRSARSLKLTIKVDGGKGILIVQLEMQ